MNLIEKIYFGAPPLLQNYLISLYGYKLYKRRYTGLYNELRKEIEDIKEFSVPKIKALQEERLHQMVAHCRTQIPYYQQIFAELGLGPNDITGLQDLNKLPILNKQTILEQSHNFRPKNGAKPFMVQHTSGSTGTPLALEVDECTYKLAMALLVDHEESHGVPFGAKRATFAGRMLKPADNMKPPFSRFNRAENQRLFSSYHLNENTFTHYKKELDKFQPEELIGYPSAIYDLATHYQNSNSKPGFEPKTIITNSETLLQWQREKIESVFGCRIYDYYGTAEYVIFAGQDKAGIYKPNPLIGITEVDIGPDSVDTGKLLATTLTNTQMPLLRYNLGDTATIEDKTLPTTGTPGLLSVNGRIDDYIETSDGRMIGRIDHVFKGVSGVQEAQVVQRQAGSATIRLVKDSTTRFRESILIANCKQRLGDDFIVGVEYVPKIPRSRNGKFRSVIREK
ncbi:phenylacetate--CoA ligase family protein [Marinobacter adhaerens]|uniref:Phenylacetate--CoA ligase family protein n=1 Tax=Marinobacter adhaerens TaxID=1033846 RepID=A0A851HTZ3_9GAMM|nr:phenylacetate--CoA ligase family protein [Marinobacter adhaerens]NWN90425.1 phenylacetate--CoA ligase family protein [Marinobacter adhaerens]